MHVQVAAEKLLLGAALEDPANARFVLLSETCVPLYPAAVVWAQLLGEPRSRLNACTQPGDEDGRMTYRWQSTPHSTPIYMTWRWDACQELVVTPFPGAWHGVCACMHTSLLSLEGRAGATGALLENGCSP